MGIKQENKYTNISSTFPNALIVDATGPGLTDGSEFAALPLNDGWESFQQACMDYAAGGTNIPAGSVGVPNGIADLAGFSQMIQAIQLANGIGPGKGVIWFTDDDPAVTGDRVLLLQGQGIQRSLYPELDAKVYVGDGNNAAAFAGGGSGLSRGAFYHADDAAGTIENPAGAYLILPESRGYAMRVLDALASVDPQGALRFLGDNQLDAFQGFDKQYRGNSSGGGNINILAGTGDVFTGGTAGSGTAYSELAGNGSRLAQNYVDDGTNGTPRPDSETRTANLSFKLGVAY